MNDDREPLTVGVLVAILRQLPQNAVVKVLASDGVEELPFVHGEPIVERMNRWTVDEFVAIKVEVSS